MPLLIGLLAAVSLIFGIYEGFLFLESSVLVLGVLIYAPFELAKDIYKGWPDFMRGFRAGMAKCKQEDPEPETDENGIPYL